MLLSSDLPEKASLGFLGEKPGLFHFQCQLIYQHKCKKEHLPICLFAHKCMPKRLWRAKEDPKLDFSGKLNPKIFPKTLNSIFPANQTCKSSQRP